MLKVVPDANIFVSALIKRGGNPDKIIRRSNDFFLFTAEEIIEETNRALHYSHIIKKYHLTEDQINKYIDSLRESSIIITSLPTIDVIKEDPTDNKILACALKAEADYIVSGDRHLRNLGTYQSVKIVTPAEFVKILEAESKKGGRHV